MEKFKSILFGLLVVLSFSACHDDDDKDTKPVLKDGSYIGTTKVTTIASGDVFTQSHKTFTLTYNDNGTLNILMKESKFAVNMPNLEIQLKQISYTQSGENISFTISSVIPEIADTPFKDFEITNLKGSIVGGQLTVDFTCMRYTVNFVGSASK